MPLELRLLQIMASILPSPDLTHQYQGNGYVAGHGNRDCIDLSPTYLQWRRATHPGITSIMYWAMELQRAGAVALIKFLAEVVEGTVPLAIDYAKAGRVTKHPRLSTAKRLACSCGL